MLDIETYMTGGAPAVADPRVAYYAAGYVRAQDLLDQNLFINTNAGPHRARCRCALRGVGKGKQSTRTVKLG